MALKRLHSARDFFRIWFFWKRQAVLGFGTVIAVIMGFAYLYTPDYESTAKIILLPRTSEGTLISAKANESVVSSVTIQDTNTEMELLLSNRVLSDAVRFFYDKAAAQKGSLGLAKPSEGLVDFVTDHIKLALNEILIFLGLKERLSPFDSSVKLLKSSIKVEPVAGSNVLLVALRAEVPKAAKVVLDKVLEVYISHHVNTFTKDEGAKFFEEQSSLYRDKLSSLEDTLLAYKKDANIVSLSQQNTANIALLSTLKQELDQLDVSIAEAEGSVGRLRAALQSSAKDLLISKEMRTIPAIIELEKSLVPLLVKRAEISTGFTESSREYQDIIKQIELIRRDMRTAIIEALQTDEFDLENKKKRKSSLQAKLTEIQVTANALAEKEKSLLDLQRQTDMVSQSYVLYAKESEDARITAERKRLGVANVALGDQASMPLEPAFPKRVLMLFISLIMGGFIAGGLPFILEFLDHRINSPGESEDLLSLPVVCVFPEVSPRD